MQSHYVVSTKSMNIPHCTSNIHGQAYLEGDCYLCETCYGLDNMIAICSQCKTSCHNDPDHKIKALGKKKFNCDCGMLGHSAKLCTVFSFGLRTNEQIANTCISNSQFCQNCLKTDSHTNHGHESAKLKMVCSSAKKILKSQNSSHCMFCLNCSEFICPACNFYCHRNHVLSTKNYPDVKCDCCKYNHQNKFKESTVEINPTMINNTSLSANLGCYNDRARDGINEKCNLYICVTCWGENTWIVNCDFCMENCHKGHEKKIRQTQGYCDCGMLAHQIDICNIYSFGLFDANQTFYNCSSCNIFNICGGCAHRHETHQLHKGQEIHGICSQAKNMLSACQNSNFDFRFCEDCHIFICRICYIICHCNHKTTVSYQNWLVNKYEYNLSCECKRSHGRIPVYVKPEKKYDKPLPIREPDPQPEIPNPNFPEISATKEMPSFLTAINFESITRDTKYEYQDTIIEFKKIEVDFGLSSEIQALLDDDKPIPIMANQVISNTNMLVDEQNNNIREKPVSQRAEKKKIDIINIDNDLALFDLDQAIKDQINIQLWKDGAVPYFIDENSFINLSKHKGGIVDTIKEAIYEWNTLCPIKFILRIDQNNYVKFTFHQYSTSSYIGMQKNPQNLNVCDQLCRKGNILHEMLHCVGFQHEHQRDDRDVYLSIRNGCTNIVQNFDKSKGLHNLDVYNYKSIMHYPLGMFQGGWYIGINEDGKEIYERTIGELNINDDIGQRKKIDEISLKRLQRICPYSVSSGNEPNKIKEKNEIDEIFNFNMDQHENLDFPHLLPIIKDHRGVGCDTNPLQQFKMTNFTSLKPLSPVLKPQNPTNFIKIHCYIIAAILPILYIVNASPLTNYWTLLLKIWATVIIIKYMIIISLFSKKYLQRVQSSNKMLILYLLALGILPLLWILLSWMNINNQSLNEKVMMPLDYITLSNRDEIYPKSLVMHLCA